MQRFYMLVFLIFINVLIIDADAQIEDLIQRYAGENAEGFIEPLITGFGANLNSGLYQSAHVPESGFHFNFRINGMLAIFSDNQKKFQAKTNGLFYPPQEVETSTIIGDPKGTVLVSSLGTEFVFPGGYDLKSFLIGAPTVTVGSFYGTEASLRYFNLKLSDDIGKLSLFGIGTRHNINQYFPSVPVDISAGFFYHQFKIGDIVDSKVWIAHAETGKSFSIIDVYTGLAYEANKAKVEYTFVSGDESAEVSVDVTGRNKFRLTLGIGFKVFPYRFNIDYAIGHQNVLNVGIGVGF